MEDKRHKPSRREGDYTCPGKGVCLFHDDINSRRDKREMEVANKFEKVATDMQEAADKFAAVTQALLIEITKLNAGRFWRNTFISVSVLVILGYAGYDVARMNGVQEDINELKKLSIGYNDQSLLEKIKRTIK
jgi:hypothetical protein